MTATTRVNPTGYTILDALIAGMKWGGPAGTGVTLTYSFPWTDGATSFPDPSGVYSTKNEPAATLHYALTTTQQAAFQTALQSWENVANISAVQVTDTPASAGDIRIAWTSATDTTSTGKNAWGWGYYPSSTHPDGGDIWLATSSSAATDNNWAVGSYNYQALIHELGHALGLSHPFDGSVVLDDAHNNRQYSIMAYNDAPNSLYLDVTYDGQTHFWQAYNVVPDTPMVYDIAAIQYLYGANMSYHTGGDVYTFDPSTPFLRTIWDAGGNDTISVANFTRGCLINLAPGSYSSISIPSDSGAGYNWSKAPPTPTYDGTNNLGIAYGAVIENAIGGSGDDMLFGNSANNTLQGNGGFNILDGGEGIDSAVYTGNFSDYNIAVLTGGNNYSVVAKNGSLTDSVLNMERLQFKDITLALNPDGLATNAQDAQYTALAQKFYVAYFGRPADAGGLANMVAQFKAANVSADIDDFVAAYKTNGAVKSLVDSFGNSGESAALYSGNNRDFVTAIYAHLLGRTPDAEGLNFWAGALDSGDLVRGLAALNILQGAEANTTTQGKIDAALIANRVTVAENFTIGLNSPALAANYAGDQAAAAARSMLDTVNQNTSITSYEANVLSTISHLPAQTHAELVGVSQSGAGTLLG